jgi:hypothetical protein
VGRQDPENYLDYEKRCSLIEQAIQLKRDGRLQEAMGLLQVVITSPDALPDEAQSSEVQSRAWLTAAWVHVELGNDLLALRHFDHVTHITTDPEMEREARDAVDRLRGSDLVEEQGREWAERYGGSGTRYRSKSDWEDGSAGAPGS